MVWPVRVILILGGAALTAGGGVWAGTVGAVQIQRAQKQIDRQTAVYSERYDLHLARVAETNQHFQTLGIALGRYVRYAPLIGPAVLVAGLAVKNEGTKAKTAAEQHRVDLEIEMANLDGRDELLRAVRERTLEVDRVLSRMIDEAIAGIEVLEAETSDEGIPAEAFQKAMILVTAVRNLATAPIADEQGRLDERTGDLILRYRDTHGKASNG